MLFLEVESIRYPDRPILTRITIAIEWHIDLNLNSFFYLFLCRSLRNAVLAELLLFLMVSVNQLVVIIIPGREREKEGITKYRSSCGLRELTAVYYIPRRCIIIIAS